MDSNRFISRKSEEIVLDLCSYFPAVAVVGPRQVGKTTLVQHLRAHIQKPTIYLDLESTTDKEKLSHPQLLFSGYEDHTIILDEVQKMPELFPLLRGIIDRNRQPGRFILLGSASPDLIRDSSETLAGRIAYYELAPFSYQEISQRIDWQTHWLRGGFPDSLLAPSEKFSILWRKNFIQTYLERDLQDLGLSADPLLTSRLWRMCAHMSGSILNYSNLSRSLGISVPTVQKYLDFFEAAYLIRRIPPYVTNLKKRMVKAPKLYIRDSGILHQLLAIPGLFELSGNPAIGASWETYVIEQIIAIAPDWAEFSFFRTQNGAKIDLVISRAGIAEVIIEIKYSSTPSLSKGFAIATEDLQPKKSFIVAPVELPYPYSPSVNVIGLAHLDLIFE